MINACMNPASHGPEEKFENKYIIRHYNERGELEKETVEYLPEYMRLKK